MGSACVHPCARGSRELSPFAHWIPSFRLAPHNAALSASAAPLPRRLCQAVTPNRHQSRALHDTVLKRYRVAAGSARTIHDYLRPPRLPSLPRFFHPSRLFSLRDPSYTHDSAMEIATGIAPHDSAMEIATGIAPASSRTRRPKLHSPPLNFPLIRHSTLTSTSQITSQNFGREDTDTRLSRTLSCIAGLKYLSPDVRRLGTDRSNTGTADRRTLPRSDAER